MLRLRKEFLLDNSKDINQEFLNEIENQHNYGAKEIKESVKNSNQVISTRLNYQTHKQAIYTSRRLNYQNLPKPINANPVFAVSKSVECPNFD
ncbi:9465_t:CDS:2 [Cetraspora pellucida]|uniref:9465_t:CDS:1 n=1 Tax=Cetraspora pellucida TaxID=1433469 RepID=A0A9N9BDC7_9GLOM|nr:9465_t:CDS:2 [Cetraspora pellucida]